MTMDSSLPHSNGSAFQAYTPPTGNGAAKGQGAGNKVSCSPGALCTAQHPPVCRRAAGAAAALCQQWRQRRCARLPPPRSLDLRLVASAGLAVVVRAMNRVAHSACMALTCCLGYCGIAVQGTLPTLSVALAETYRHCSPGVWPGSRRRVFASSGAVAAAMLKGGGKQTGGDRPAGVCSPSGSRACHDRLPAAALQRYAAFPACGCCRRLSSLLPLPRRCPPCIPLPPAPAAFRYSSHLTPRRLLTKPAEPAGNSGWDNATHDLIVAVGDEFVSTLGSRWGRWLGDGAGVGCLSDKPPAASTSSLSGRHRQPDPDAELPPPHSSAVQCSQQLSQACHVPLLCCCPAACRYVVRDLLGQGTFGQVFKCVCTDSVAAGGEEQEGDIIAIKVGGGCRSAAHRVPANLPCCPGNLLCCPAPVCLRCQLSAWRSSLPQPQLPRP